MRIRVVIVAAALVLGWRLARAPLARGAPGDDAVDPATREMAALLEERAALVNPEALSLIVNDKRAELLNGLLARPMPVAERLPLRGRAVVELAQAGRPREALRALEALEQDARESDPGNWQRYRAGARLVEAMAYMRLAEDENCHAAPSRDACLLPIRGGGVHQRREGGEGAVRALLEVLSQDPGSLRARWLLNIASMTLGKYPDGVPERFLIPPSTFASDYPLARFDNVAAEAGVDFSALAGGAVLEDFDGDGRLDLMWSAMGFSDQMRFLRNRGDGTFEDRTAEAGLSGETGGLNMVPADYDNDGNVDVLVLRGGWLGSEGRFPVSLLRNDGHGRFRDVTKAAGLLGHLAPTQTAVFFDFDGDGRLDLFIGNESAWIPDFVSERRAADSFPSELYHSNGDGTFTKMARGAGLDVVAFVKGVVSADYDNDGRPDLYVSIWGEPNRLFHNDGPGAGPGSWRFTEVAAKAGVTRPVYSFGSFFFDYDDDGWPDLFVAGYGKKAGIPTVEDVAAAYLGLPTEAERDRLYRNRGDGTFEDVSKAVGLDKVTGGMALNYGDLDGDGWLDFYLGTGTPDLGMLVPNRMFRNDAGKRFQEVTTAGNFGHLQKGHAIAFGDYDNDGHQDVFEQMGGAYLGDTARSALYRNPGNDNAWIGLELEGVRANRRGVGARIALAVDTGAGERVIHRTVGSGGSFGGNPMRQEIGLGKAKRVLRLDVVWPASGETQRVTGLRPGRRYRIREGSARADEVVWPKATAATARPAAAR
jgi:hypothetical protein